MGDGQTLPGYARARRAASPGRAENRGGDAHGALEEGSGLEEITETSGLDPSSSRKETRAAWPSTVRITSTCPLPKLLPDRALTICTRPRNDFYVHRDQDRLNLSMVYS